MTGHIYRWISGKQLPEGSHKDIPASLFLVTEYVRIIAMAIGFVLLLSAACIFVVLQKPEALPLGVALGISLGIPGILALIDIFDTHIQLYKKFGEPIQRGKP
jgi:hypothetical protein